MNRLSQRGATLVEVLVYSFLAAIIASMLFQLMGQYGDLSGYFNQRSAVNSQTLMLFRNVGMVALESNDKGVTVSSDQKKVIFQKIDGVTGSGLTLWSPNLTVLWYDSGSEKVQMGQTDLATIGATHIPELAATLTETQLAQAVSAATNPRTMADGLQTFSASRPTSKELKLEIEYQNKGKAGGNQGYQRQRTFFLMTDGEL